MSGSGSDPVNLNRYRKAKARTGKKARAAENAVKFGRTRAEKLRDSAKVDKARRDLDGHKRDEDAP